MSSGSPRLLRVLYYVESLDIGGANQSTVTAAVALKRRGHEVFHASLNGPLREKLDAAEIPHFDLDTRVNHPSLSLARRIGAILDREKIDVVCPNGWDCTMDAFLAAAPRGVPMVPTFPGMFLPDYAHPRVPAAIVYSGEYRDALIRRFGGRPESLVLLINRIDTDRFRPGLDGTGMRREWGLDAQAPVVLMACRLDTTKIAGVHYLLDAIRPLVERRPDVRVVVAGDGDRREEVAVRVDRLHRELGREVVILAGRVLAMERAFAAADLVVGNGARSGLEGLACGKPVVSVGPAGMAGVLAPETIEDFAYYNFDKGLVFDGSSRREPEALADEIAGLLADPERRRSLGEFGAGFSRRRLSAEAGMERLEQMLHAARRRSFTERLGDRREFVRCFASFATFALRRKFRRMVGMKGPPPGLPGGTAPERSFLRNSVTTFLASLFGVGVGVVQSAVVARILLPEGKGQLAAAVMIPQLAATIAPLGINWACTYHLGRKTFDRETLIRSALTALLLLSGIGVGISLTAGILMRPTLLAGVPWPAFLLALLTLPTSIFLLCLSGLFRGEMRIAEANRMDISRTALMFLSILLFVAGFRMGAAGVVLAQFTAEAIVGARAFRRFGVSPVPLLRWDVVRTLTGYGLQIYSFSILLYLNYRFDMFLVREKLDLIQTGLYATAVSLAEMLWMVPNSLGIVLFPSVARATGEERDRLALAVCRNTFWLMLLLCSALALGRNLALRVFFGAPFVAAAPALLAILPGILAMSVQQVLGSALSGRGRPLPVTLGAGLGFSVNVALNLLWIPRFGIVGASLASSVSYLLVAGVVLVAFLRISGRGWREAFQLGPEDFRRISGALGRLREAVA